MKTKRPTIVPTENDLLHLHSEHEAFLEIDIKNSKVFRVDQQTDTLTHEQLRQHWPRFEASDRKELQQFVEQGIFRKIWLEDWKME